MSVACPSEEFLAQYLASTLAEPHRDSLETHLEGCDACARLVATLAGTCSSVSMTGAKRPLVELEIGAQIGRYVVMGEINRGGMGVVYEAYDAELDRKIALKVIGESASGRARREARAMASLSSPQVVGIFDLLLLGDATVIAMELVEGPTLRDWLWREKPGLAAIRRVFAEAGTGLQAAHDIGIVHCDFKPENVLLGAGALAKVSDFGLARWDQDAQRPFGGTPGYIAPELFAGQPPSPASDQYSFAMSYAEALLDRKISDPIKAFATVPDGVPRALWSALERGIAPAPEARYESMAELLKSLEATKQNRRRPLAGAAAAAVLLSAVWVLATNSASSAPQASCDGADADMARVWSPARRTAFSQSFPAESGVESATLATETADHYAERWSLAHRAVCLASQQGEQSDALLDQRMTCLQHRLTSFASLVEALSNSSDAARARTAFAGLPAISDCQRLEPGSELLALPAPGERRTRIEARTSELYELRALLLSRNLDAAEKPLLAMGPAVDELDYGPLTAHYYHQLGVFYDARGDYPTSIVKLEHAAKAAALAHDDLRQAHVLTLLVGVRGYRMGNIEQGKAWADAARLAIERVNADADLRISFHHNLGMVLTQGGEYASARESLESALALIEAQPGSSHNLMSTLDALGTTYYREENFERARSFHERAIAVGEEDYGPGHAALASPINNLALVAWRLEDYPQAIASFERALDLTERQRGPRTPEVGMILTNIALVHISSGDLAAAARGFDKALPIIVENFGTDHPMVATLYSNKAFLASEQGQLDTAVELAEQALQTRRKFGEDHPGVLDDHFNLAGLLCQADRRSEAGAHFDAVTTKSADKADAAAWRKRVKEARGECKGGNSSHAGH